MNKSLLSLFAELEKTRKEFWNIPREVGIFLNQLIKTRNYKNCLEVGTSNGYSALWIAEALASTGGHLYTVESNKKKRFPLAQQNIKKSGLNKYITQILGHAPEAIPATPRKFDFAFFDATKYEHIDYLKSIAPRIKKGGTIITDNILSHKKDLTAYVKEVQKQKNWESVILPIGTGIMVSTKTA